MYLSFSLSPLSNSLEIFKNFILIKFRKQFLLTKGYKTWGFQNSILFLLLRPQDSKDNKYPKGLWYLSIDLKNQPSSIMCQLQQCSKKYLELKFKMILCKVKGCVTINFQNWFLLDLLSWIWIINEAPCSALIFWWWMDCSPVHFETSLLLGATLLYDSQFI